MGCRVENITREELSNVKKYNSFYAQPYLNQTAEETVTKMVNLNNTVQKVNEDYHVLDYVFPEKKRVSTVGKRKWGKRSESLTHDNEIIRAGGTQIHAVMAKLMNHFANNIGTLDGARSFTLEGADIKMTTSHFSSLVKLSKKLLEDIKKQQNEIDKNGKFTVLVETFLPDFINGIAGTEDIAVVFSDNTGLLYDLKTTYRTINSQGQLNYNPFPYYEINDKHMSQAEYKRIWEERIGIKFVRQNRLIPIAVDYKNKRGVIKEKGESLLPEIDSIATVLDDMEHLRAIPTGGESSKWRGINILIEKQFALVDRLSKQLKKTIALDERSHIVSRIQKIEKSIGDTLVDEEIGGIISTIDELGIEVATRLDEPQFNEKNEVNKAYLSDEDVDTFRQEMSLYENIIAETDSYFKDIKEEYPEKYDRLIVKLDSLKGPFERVLFRLNSESQLRRSKEVAPEYKDEKGFLFPTQELNFGKLKFFKISEINHPVFQAAWKVIEKTQDEIKQKILALDEEVYDVEDALQKWANGYFSGFDKKMQAYRMLINEKTGNMYSKLRVGAIRDINAKISDSKGNAMNVAKQYYQFKNKETWEKEYKLRLEGYKTTRKAAYSNFAPTMEGDKVKTSASTKKSLYDKDVERWVENNNLSTSATAWTIASNRRKYLTLKPEVVEDNLSDEYRKIRSIKPLHDLYELWNSKMEEFAEVLGIADFTKLPPNFIPNIRKEMIEYVDANGFHLGDMAKEFNASLHAREEDTYLNSFNPDGVEREIPILFINKFFTKEGKIDNAIKSFDLAKSMMMFGKMAYSYENMNKIEATLNGLKNLLGDPVPEQGGTEVTNRLSQRIKGRVQAYATKKGRETETYNLFENIIDFYLYGIKFKNKTFMPGVDVVHNLTKLKNLNSMLKLSFAIIPAAGAYLAGTTGLTQLAKKGIQFNSKQLANAYVMLAGNKLAKGITDFFDAENDDYFERELQKHKSSIKNKILNERTGFAPLRNADSSLTDITVLSMVQNWGVKEDGSLIRLNRKIRTADGKLTTVGELGKYKTLLELAVKDDKGKVTITGLSREGYRQFRAAVKSTTGEVIGNMNPDDIGAVDTDFYMNQMMAFKSWMPALVQEYTGGLTWNDTTQSMKWGRFMAYLNDYRKDLNFTEDQIKEGKLFWQYMGKVVAPNLSKLILDISTFGLVPSIRNSRVNEQRAKLMFYKWQLKNPSLREKVTYEDFLEIKQGQIKAMIVQLRFLIGIMGLAMFLGGAGDDGKPRYMDNFVTRTFFKTFSKAGSELTFMWNPSEFLRLVRNPVPLTGLLVQLQKTVFNGFNEGRELVFGPNEKDKRDTTPAGYYTLQWMYGGSQLERFFEVYKNFQRSQYQVFSSQTQ
jgi:hypothetical protein